MASAGAPASPSSSPRLPSPPPFPEVQIGPKSPSPGGSPGPAALDPSQEHGEDDGATRRIRPGTKAADMASGPPLVPLAELDSPFQLQEYLLSLFLNATRSPSSPTLSIPITRETATKLATPPTGVDRALWLYELCRLLVQRANSLIVGFFADTPPCSATACPEMRASEWQYLCAVHDPPKSCCAIDYCCHTLDWAANTLTSQKHFPSRLSLGGDAPGSSQQSVRQLTNIFRRVYRMFAHAWFQHREVFWRLEGEEGLYVFYKTVCDVYNLIPEENYTVPKEAEGIPEESETAVVEGGKEKAEEKQEGPRERPTSIVESTPGAGKQESAQQSTLSTGATTRRHKHTPSTGSFVTTIQESDEDEGEKKEGLGGLPTLVSTVRRDPTSSPPKQPPPVPQIREESKEEEAKEEEVNEDKKEEEEVKDEGAQAEEPKESTSTAAEEVGEKIAEMSIEDKTLPEPNAAGAEAEKPTEATTGEDTQVEEKPSVAEQPGEPEAATQTADADATTSAEDASGPEETEKKDEAAADSVETKGEEPSS